jgi:hypothetical protein
MTATLRCKVCGAILPENLICEYCGADNSPEFRAKFDDKGIGNIEYNGEQIKCYISDIEVESLYGDAGRYLDGRIARVAIAKKRTFTVKEL